ncbi:uncharacterized protein C21orf58 homolog isoform X2 [Pelodiscus sinensis]|uniref:uncharacterized protein C21orf58 homolog isoform X2 n=1 Tax=Pelodiscus sinensis TaxID=13735 RepID=UPI003F6BC7E3
MGRMRPWARSGLQASPLRPLGTGQLHTALHSRLLPLALLWVTGGREMLWALPYSQHNFSALIGKFLGLRQAGSLPRDLAGLLSKSSLDSSMVDHMTRMKLKLLEKKLENERETLENIESPLSTTRGIRADRIPLSGTSDGHENALQNALKRRKDLLQKLRKERNRPYRPISRTFRLAEELLWEQHLLEEFSQPYILSRDPRKSYKPAPGPAYLPSALAPAPEPPRIIQHTMPQQPATIIQQLPPQAPLITQIPPPQPLTAPRSGSIKEDMVEMMLMQNAQMHQIVMQNMMLKALPPMAFSQPTGTGPPLLQYTQQPQFAAPVMVKAEKPRPSAVHHHHYYPLPGLQALPSQLPIAGCSAWPPVMPSSLGGEPGGFPSAVHHTTGPTSIFSAMNR